MSRAPLHCTVGGKSDGISSHKKCTGEYFIFFAAHCTLVSKGQQNRRYKDFLEIFLTLSWQLVQKKEMYKYNNRNLARPTGYCVNAYCVD